MITIKQQHVSNQRNTMAGQENLWSQPKNFLHTCTFTANTGNS